MTDEFDASPWNDATAFLPLDAADAERQRVQRNAVGAVTAWDDIVAMYQKMFPQTLKPTDPRSWTPYIDRTDPEQVRAAYAALEGYEEYMARERSKKREPVATSEPWADVIVDYLRHLELDAAGVPPIGPRLQQRRTIARIRWTPRAYAGLRGLTGEAADMFVGMAEALQRDHD